MFITRSYEDAILVPSWKQAMDKEMNALLSRGTWELVSAPIDVGCRWVYTPRWFGGSL